jgi:hypothetical protein
MADARLNSLHLETDRRQEFRRARELLLRARGGHTVFASPDAASALGDQTVIRRSDAQDSHTANQLDCWLSDGEFLYPLQVGVNTLGRSSDNDVTVEDPFVSRRHCAILVHSTERAELHDTASKNGTYVNGKRLSEPAVLQSGDEIRISERQYVFFTRGGPGSAASPQATLSG